MRRYKKKYYYAAYDLRSPKETCLGVWDNARDVAKALGLSDAAVYRNVRQTHLGRKFSRLGFGVVRIPK